MDFIKDLNRKCFLQQRLCLPCRFFQLQSDSQCHTSSIYTSFIGITLCVTDFVPGHGPSIAVVRCPVLSVLSQVAWAAP